MLVHDVHTVSGRKRAESASSKQMSVSRATSAYLGICFCLTTDQAALVLISLASQQCNSVTCTTPIRSRSLSRSQRRFITPPFLRRLLCRMRQRREQIALIFRLSHPLPVKSQLVFVTSRYKSMHQLQCGSACVNTTHNQTQPNRTKPNQTKPCWHGNLK